MKKKNVLVLAGGNWQVPLINFFKAKGEYVIVVDPYSDSTGVLLSNYHIKLDVKDSKKILEEVLQLPFSIDYAISDQSDIAIKSLAEINAALKLPGILPEIAILFTNKFSMREFAFKIGVPVPSFKKCFNINDLINFFEINFKRPIMLKPADSQSSRGIFKISVDNIDSASELLANCFLATQLNFVICEQFIEGVELTAEGFCSNNIHTTLALSCKKHFRTGIASDLIYPSALSDRINNKIREYNNHFVTNSKLKFGITHAEYIYNEYDDEVYLVEIACRGGGTLISSNIIKWVSGFDAYEELYKNLNGLETNLNEIENLNRAAILHFFEFPNGIVSEISGMDDIGKMENVIKLQLDFKVGDTINFALDDRSRQGFIIITAETIEILNSLMIKVNSLLQVKVV